GGFELEQEPSVTGGDLGGMYVLAGGVGHAGNAVVAQRGGVEHGVHAAQAADALQFAGEIIVGGEGLQFMPVELALVGRALARQAVHLPASGDEGVRELPAQAAGGHVREATRAIERFPRGAESEEETHTPGGSVQAGIALHAGFATLKEGNRAGAWWRW